VPVVSIAPTKIQLLRLVLLTMNSSLIVLWPWLPALLMIRPPLLARYVTAWARTSLGEGAIALLLSERLMILMPLSAAYRTAAAVFCVMKYSDFVP